MFTAEERGALDTAIADLCSLSAEALDAQVSRWENLVPLIQT